MNVVVFLALWLLFAAIEVLLVGKLDAEETPVGVVVGALAALGIATALRASGDRYRFRLAWFALVPKLVANVVRDTAIVFGVLLRRLAGGPLPDDAIVHVPFDAGGRDAESAAHRALAIAAVSFAPNSIALDVEPKRGTLRVHYLRSDVQKPASREWPV